MKKRFILLSAILLGNAALPAQPFKAIQEETNYMDVKRVAKQLFIHNPYTASSLPGMAKPAVLVEVEASVFVVNL